MFRCDNCGSGYSTQAATSWTSCPRCLAKERVQVPLTFELGWQRQQKGPVVERLAPQVEVGAGREAA
jgi:DNA-directed RNA polymerase subunit RPC12/RpoP